MGHSDGMRGPSQQDLQVSGGEWLGEVVPGPGLQGLETRRHRRVAGHDDDEGLWVCLEACLEQLDSGYLGHVQIEQHDVEAHAFQRVEGLVTLKRSEEHTSELQ